MREHVRQSLIADLGLQARRIHIVMVQLGHLQQLGHLWLINLMMADNLLEYNHIHFHFLPQALQQLALTYMTFHYLQPKPPLNPADRVLMGQYQDFAQGFQTLCL